MTAGIARVMSEAKLDRELAVYRRELPQLLKSEGKFALVVGDTLVGVFDAYADALHAGYQKAGLKPFLVKRISGAETLAYFTREICAGCPV